MKDPRRNKMKIVKVDKQGRVSMFSKNTPPVSEYYMVKIEDNCAFKLIPLDTDLKYMKAYLDVSIDQLTKEKDEIK